MVITSGQFWAHVKSYAESSRLHYEDEARKFKDRAATDPALAVERAGLMYEEAGHCKAYERVLDLLNTGKPAQFDDPMVIRSFLANLIQEAAGSMLDPGGNLRDAGRMIEHRFYLRTLANLNADAQSIKS